MTRTARHGISWTDEETDKMLELVENSKTIIEIVDIHKRTSGTIRSKLCTIAYKLYTEGKQQVKLKKKIKDANTIILCILIKQ